MRRCSLELGTEGDGAMACLTDEPLHVMRKSWGGDNALRVSRFYPDGRLGLLNAEDLRKLDKDALDVLDLTLDGIYLKTVFKVHSDRRRCEYEPAFYGLFRETLEGFFGENEWYAYFDSVDTWRRETPRYSRSIVFDDPQTRVYFDQDRTRDPALVWKTYLALCRYRATMFADEVDQCWGFEVFDDVDTLGFLCLTEVEGGAVA
jgi:hypothetical protein